MPTKFDVREIVVTEELRARFFSKFPGKPWVRCWELSSKHYPKISVAPRKVAYAHRIAWTINHGSIPGGLLVLHRCDNRRCCNPAHLFLGSHEDNTRDMIEKGRAKFDSWAHAIAVRVARQRAKTHCKHGHEFSGTNLKIMPDGSRRCRACGAMRMRGYRAEKMKCS